MEPITLGVDLGRSEIRLFDGETLACPPAFLRISSRRISSEILSGSSAQRTSSEEFSGSASMFRRSVFTVHVQACWTGRFSRS